MYDNPGLVLIPLASLLCVLCLEKEQCTSEDGRLVLGSLVGMAVLLLVTVMCFLVWNIYKVHEGRFFVHVCY